MVSNGTNDGIYRSCHGLVTACSEADEECVESGEVARFHRLRGTEVLSSSSVRAALEDLDLAGVLLLPRPHSAGCDQPGSSHQDELCCQAWLPEERPLPDE